MIKYTQKSNLTDSITREIDYIIKQGKTKFQEYLFFNSKTNGVCIALDDDIQSCEVDEILYHEALVHPAMLLHKSPKNVLIMGGGEGATAREVLKHSSVLEKVVMVDIDEEFVELCKKTIPSWSKDVFDNHLLEVRYEDINQYLQKTNIKFDVVIGDLVDVNNWDSSLKDLYSDIDSTIYRIKTNEIDTIKHHLTKKGVILLRHKNNGKNELVLLTHYTADIIFGFDINRPDSPIGLLSISDDFDMFYIDNTINLRETFKDKLLYLILSIFH